MEKNTDTKKSNANQTYRKMAEEITSGYVFLLLVIYPFYFQNKYYNIGNAKWNFFSILTLGSGILLVGNAVFYLTTSIRKHETYKIRAYLQNGRVSVIDKFVILYTIIVLVSTLLSPYKSLVIWGTDGWHMGVVAQVCFVLIYYFVSRYWKWDSSAIVCYLGAAFLVFLLAVLMRFRIDPLKLYQGLEEQYVINFLTTIGQATWYSSYVVLLFPIGVFAFWFYDNMLVHILTGIFTMVGFMTTVTQNSDSIFAALGILLFVLFWVSLESNKRWKRFLEVLIICFFSFKFIGICQLMFPTRAVPLDPFFVFCSQSNCVWILLAVAVIAYLGFWLLEKFKHIDISKIKVIRVIVLILSLTAVLFTVIYIYLNTTGKLPENIRSNNNYLLFNKEWGNNRGLSWIAAVDSFFKGSPVRKIAGCGPDGFSLYIKNFYSEELAQKWGESVALTCAHNEWLNAFVNVGILGGTAYAGIFISAVLRFMKRAGRYPELLAIGICILCYMGHNFFCYQQIVCTPIVFILMGAGEGIIRQKAER